MLTRASLSAPSHPAAAPLTTAGEALQVGTGAQTKLASTAVVPAAESVQPASPAASPPTTSAAAAIDPQQPADTAVSQAKGQQNQAQQAQHAGGDTLEQVSDAAVPQPQGRQQQQQPPQAQHAGGNTLEQVADAAVSHGQVQELESHGPGGGMAVAAKGDPKHVSAVGQDTEVSKLAASGSFSA